MKSPSPITGLPPYPGTMPPFAGAFHPESMLLHHLLPCFIVVRTVRAGKSPGSQSFVRMIRGCQLQDFLLGSRLRALGCHAHMSASGFWCMWICTMGPRCQELRKQVAKAKGPRYAPPLYPKQSSRDFGSTLQRCLQAPDATQGCIPPARLPASGVRAPMFFMAFCGYDKSGPRFYISVARSLVLRHLRPRLSCALFGAFWSC